MPQIISGIATFSMLKTQQTNDETDKQSPNAGYASRRDQPR